MSGGVPSASPHPKNGHHPGAIACDTLGESISVGKLPAGTVMAEVQSGPGAEVGDGCVMGSGWITWNKPVVKKLGYRDSITSNKPVTKKKGYIYIYIYIDV